MERRKHPRFVCQYSISFVGGGITGSGTVSNLSMGGCTMQTDTDVHVGTYMEFRISSPDYEQPIPVGLAGVRWVKGQECGLEFINMEPEEQARLRRLLRTLETSPSH